MSEVEQANSEGAPKPKGAYSAVVRGGDFLFVSGQGPVDPATGKFVLTDIRGQTRLTLENVERALASQGASRKNIVKCGVFLADATDFHAMNEIYGAFFEGERPARTTVGTSMVEPGMKVEIDCVAYFPVK